MQSIGFFRLYFYVRLPFRENADMLRFYQVHWKILDGIKSSFRCCRHQPRPPRYSRWPWGGKASALAFFNHRPVVDHRVFQQPYNCFRGWNKFSIAVAGSTRAGFQVKLNMLRAFYNSTG